MSTGTSFMHFRIPMELWATFLGPACVRCPQHRLFVFLTPVMQIWIGTLNRYKRNVTPEKLILWMVRFFLLKISCSPRGTFRKKLHIKATIRLKIFIINLSESDPKMISRREIFYGDGIPTGFGL